MTPALTRTYRAVRRRVALTGQAGMTTAEYAVGTLAACAFAAVLIAVVRSGRSRRPCRTDAVTITVSVPAGRLGLALARARAGPAPGTAG